MIIKGKIRSGHGVASGKAYDARYPEGTLKMQYDHFLKRGLDLNSYFLGTVNLDIAPYHFEIKKPKHFFSKVRWSEYIPAENFYFFDVSLLFGEEQYNGLIYMPDPETKIEHEQKATVLELILPRVESLSYGEQIAIAVREDQLSFYIP